MTHNLTHTAKCAERFRKHRTGGLTFLPGIIVVAGLLLHDLRHEAAHGFRRLTLHLSGGVGVDVGG